MRIEFVIYGDPVGWERTGYNGFTGAKYTQKKTRDMECAIKKAYTLTAGGIRFGDKDYIRLTVKNFLYIPKDTSKKKRDLMNTGVILPTKNRIMTILLRSSPMP